MKDLERLAFGDSVKRVRGASEAMDGDPTCTNECGVDETSKQQFVGPTLDLSAETFHSQMAPS